MRILAIGAHPDDCEIKVGGTAAKWAALHHDVKFLSLTTGDNGHPTQAGGALAQRRHAEVKEAAQRLGIAAAEVLDSHGGELSPSLEMRRVVVRKIREWESDVVLTCRPNDYHPDHRYCSILVQDAAYMVTVPFYVSSVPALSKNPVFIYFEDDFQRPQPLRPDVAVVIDEVIDQKTAGLDAHVSQMYEWLPFMSARAGEPLTVPDEPDARRDWLRRRWFDKAIADDVRHTLRRWYGPAADSARYAEAFEICEYGRQPSELELREIFPFFPEKQAFRAPHTPNSLPARDPAS